MYSVYINKCMLYLYVSLDMYNVYIGMHAGFNFRRCRVNHSNVVVVTFRETEIIHGFPPEKKLEKIHLCSFYASKGKRT